MTDPFTDDEALPDAQVITCVGDCIDIPLSVKPARQRTASQQWLIRENESNVDVVKFDASIINSGFVSYLHRWEVSFAPDPSLPKFIC